MDCTPHPPDTGGSNGIGHVPILSLSIELYKPRPGSKQALSPSAPRIWTTGSGLGHVPSSPDSKGAQDAPLSGRFLVTIDTLTHGCLGLR
jgi:hypothetical protein